MSRLSAPNHVQEPSTGRVVVSLHYNCFIVIVVVIIIVLVVVVVVVVDVVIAADRMEPWALVFPLELHRAPSQPICDLSRLSGQSL